MNPLNHDRALRPVIVKVRAGLFEAGLRKPRVSANFELRYESLKSLFGWILFAYNLMIGYAKKIEKIIPEGAFDKKKKKPGLKLNPGLPLTRLQATGPRVIFQVKPKFFQVLYQLLRLFIQLRGSFPLS